MKARLLSTGTTLVLACLLGGGGAAAQERIYVRAEPGTPVVAVEVLVAAGPADEAEGQAGITYLAARSVVEPARALLDSLGVRLQVDQHKDAVAFTLTAAPDVWAEASRTLLSALFRDAVDSAATARVRRTLVRELQARETSPADALARELERAVYGPGHPWGRPSVGTARSVGALGVRAVDPFVRANFTPERSVVAVVGPVEYEEVAAELGPHMPEGPLRLAAPAPPRPATDLVQADYNSITTWVSASWHFGAEADLEALTMLAHLAHQQVSFGPSRRSVYNSRAEVIRYAGGGELRLHVVVPPREAAQWAGRLREAVQGYAREPLSGPAFTERLRRYRGERLLALDSPEARAAAMARAALLGDHTATLADFQGLSAERLHRAARSLDAPVLVFLGPTGDQGM